MVEVTQVRQIVANHIGWVTYEDAAAHNHHTDEYVEVALAVTTDLQAKLDKAVEALEKSRDTFRRYGDLHSAKATRDADQKAAVNWALSMDMDETISEIKGGRSFVDQKAERMLNHMVTRQSDEYACSCGRRWDVEDGPDHP